MAPAGMRPARVAVLISGTGSNMQALIAARAACDFAVCAVISNRPDAPGLGHAAAAGIPTAVLDHRQYPDRASYDRDLGDLIEGFEPDVVALAGFMRILTPALVRRFQGQMLNIHPSLLPKFQGLDTHARVLAAGEAVHGCSVHFVTPELDGGPVIIQAKVQIAPGEAPQALAARVLEREHRIYPLAVRLLSRGMISMRDDAVMLDGTPLPAPLDLDRLPPKVAALAQH